MVGGGGGGYGVPLKWTEAECLRWRVGVKRCRVSPSSQVYDPLEEGAERDREDDQEGAEASGSRHEEDGHEDGPERLVLQLLHPADGYVWGAGRGWSLSAESG